MTVSLGRALLMLLATIRLGAAQDTARVELIFLDVGQGDAVVIRGPGPKVALIDAGPSGRRVVAALRELGVDTGDAEIPELVHFAALALPRITVLKASHHGARNGYGHPHPEAVRYYERSRAAVYRTSTHGRITVRGARDGTYEVTASHVP